MSNTTTLQHLISELKKSPNKVVTIDNVIFLAESLLELEKDQLIDMGNRYYKPLRQQGILTIEGEKMFERVYGKKNEKALPPTQG